MLRNDFVLIIGPDDVESIICPDCAHGGAGGGIVGLCRAAGGETYNWIATNKGVWGDGWCSSCGSVNMDPSQEENK